MTSLTDLPSCGRKDRARFNWALLVGLLSFVYVQASSLKAEGFGPFPVRNFQSIQQLVLKKSGDRAAGLKKGLKESATGSVPVSRNTSYGKATGPKTSSPIPEARQTSRARPIDSSHE